MLKVAKRGSLQHAVVNIWLLNCFKCFQSVKALFKNVFQSTVRTFGICFEHLRAGFVMCDHLILISATHSEGGVKTVTLKRLEVNDSTDSQGPLYMA